MKYTFFSKVYYRVSRKKISSKNLPSDGRWAQLSKGNIYYRWHHPEQKNGQTIVMVHGFSTPSFVWNGLLDGFLNKGYSILVYDHYGRGFSERPRTKYSLDFYVETLKELISHQSIDETFDYKQEQLFLLKELRRKYKLTTEELIEKRDQIKELFLNEPDIDIKLKDIINAFQVAYVGAGKLIPSVKRTDLIFFAKRAMQEFSYDTLKSIKSQELTIPHNLSVILPQD